MTTWTESPTGNFYRRANDGDTGQVIIAGLVWAASRQETISIDAANAGAAAFHAGRMRVPAHDPAVIELMGTNPGNALPILNAWLRAWDTENLR